MRQVLRTDVGLRRGRGLAGQLPGRGVQRQRVHARDPVRQRRGGQHQGHRGVLDHVAQPLARVRRVQWHVRAAGLEHPEQGDQQLRPPVEADAHPALRTDAAAPQEARELVGRGVQLRVARLLASEHQRDGVRRPRRLRGEEGVHAGPRRGSPLPWRSTPRGAARARPRPGRRRRRRGGQRPRRPPPPGARSARPCAPWSPAPTAPLDRRASRRSPARPPPGRAGGRTWRPPRRRSRGARSPARPCAARPARCSAGRTSPGTGASGPGSAPAPAPPPGARRGSPGAGTPPASFPAPAPAARGSSGHRRGRCAAPAC